MFLKLTFFMIGTIICGLASAVVDLLRPGGLESTGVSGSQCELVVVM